MRVLIKRVALLVPKILNIQTECMVKILSSFLTSPERRKQPPYVPYFKGVLLLMGRSTSLFKERTYYMFKGSLDDVNRVWEECGSFSSIKSIKIQTTEVN